MKMCLSDWKYMGTGFGEADGKHLQVEKLAEYSEDRKRLEITMSLKQAVKIGKL